MGIKEFSLLPVEFDIPIEYLTILAQKVVQYILSQSRCLPSRSILYQVLSPGNLNCITVINRFPFALFLYEFCHGEPGKRLEGEKEESKVRVLIPQASFWQDAIGWLHPLTRGQGPNLVSISLSLSFSGCSNSSLLLL